MTTFQKNNKDLNLNSDSRNKQNRVFFGIKGIVKVKSSNLVTKYDVQIKRFKK